MISVPQLFRNRLEDVTNLYNTVFCQLYCRCMSCIKNRKSWKGKSFESPQTRKKQKRLCRKIFRELFITHTSLVHSEPSNTSKMELYTNMARVLLLRLKVNYQKQKTGKESIKPIMRHSKVNNCLFIMNPAVTYEMDYYIFNQEL